MSALICKNCQALENIIAKKINWFNLLSAENISLHHTLTTTRNELRHLQVKISNLQKSSFNDQQEIVKLYIETEYLKCQLNKDAKSNHLDNKKMLPLIEYQNKIQTEQQILVENEKDLWKKQSELHIQKLQEHVKILLEELEICHKELISQSKHYLNERQLFRELSNEEKLKTEIYLNHASKENMEATHIKMQSKFDKILKYKDEQIKRQEDLINVLKKQQDAVNNQFHKLSKNKDKAAVQYKYETGKINEELEKLHAKYDKLEKRRKLEAEGYKTQIKLLNDKYKK